MFYPSLLISILQHKQTNNSARFNLDEGGELDWIVDVAYCQHDKEAETMKNICEWFHKRILSVW